MKKILLAVLFIVGLTLDSQSVIADPGMPKAFSVLTGVAGPVVSGQLSEINLRQMKPAKDQDCMSYASYVYQGVPLRLTVAGEEYVMDPSFALGMSFVDNICELKPASITYMLLKFDHIKLKFSVGVEIDMLHNIIKFSSRDIGSAAGVITTKY